MSKIVTEVDAQIKSAKAKFEAAKLEIVKTLAPVHQLVSEPDPCSERDSTDPYDIPRRPQRAMDFELNCRLDDNLTL